VFTLRRGGAPLGASMPVAPTRQAWQQCNATKSDLFGTIAPTVCTKSFRSHARRNPPSKKKQMYLKGNGRSGIGTRFQLTSGLRSGASPADTTVMSNLPLARRMSSAQALSIPPCSWTSWATRTIRERHPCRFRVELTMIRGQSDFEGGAGLRSPTRSPNALREARTQVHMHGSPRSYQSRG
jgi:hypothetical protein